LAISLTASHLRILFLRKQEPLDVKEIESQVKKSTNKLLLPMLLKSVNVE